LKLEVVCADAAVAESRALAGARGLKHFFAVDFKLAVGVARPRGRARIETL